MLYVGLIVLTFSVFAYRNKMPWLLWAILGVAAHYGGALAGMLFLGLLDFYLGFKEFFFVFFCGLIAVICMFLFMYNRAKGRKTKEEEFSGTE